MNLAQRFPALYAKNATFTKTLRFIVDLFRNARHHENDCMIRVVFPLTAHECSLACPAALRPLIVRTGGGLFLPL
jgi:hypothetical protein